MSDGLEARLEQLERSVEQIREEWTVVQQAPMIQARLLNALRETQVEHGQRLDRIEGALGDLATGQETLITMIDRLLRQGD